MKNILPLFLVIAFLTCCSKTENVLPKFGHFTVSDGDTVYSTINPFEFINQDSVIITKSTFNDKIYVADFIFLTCPSICPIMTRELKKVYLAYHNNPNVYFLSHTIDPDYDTVPRLNQYAKDLGVDNTKWHFVTGNRDSIYTTAEKSYFAATLIDSTAPGGFIHSGSFFLVDKNMQIRGVYNGTNPDETERLIKDLKTLLTEQYN